HARYDLDAEALTNRILVTEYLPRDPVIKNANVRSTRNIIILEVTSGKEWDTECAEIVRTCRTGIDINDGVATFEFNLESLRLPAKREPVNDGGGLHTGRGLDTVDETR